MSVDVVARGISGGKLNKNLGSDNAGKFLIVGTDGNIAFITLEMWESGEY